jgi:hypothetical protein
MTLDEALAEIRSFWTDGPIPFAGGGNDHVTRLAGEFGMALPREVQQYVRFVLPPRSYAFHSVGNSIEVYGFESLSRRADGYNINSVTAQTIDGWENDWLLIADEGADPFIVELSRRENASPVLQAMHGAGDWEFAPVADSIAQFVLMTAARHHALTILGKRCAIIDDEDGFNLDADIAAWLFPYVRKWAPAYYDDWVGAFDNS